MDDGGGGRQFVPTGGQIILSALQNSSSNKSQTPSQESLTMDPAVAAVGPTLPQQPWLSSPSSSLSSYEHDLFLQSFRRTQNPWSSLGNTNFPGNPSHHDDIWRLGFQNQNQNHKPEMPVASFPLNFINSESLLNSNRVDNVVAASDLLSRLKGLNDNTGLGLGNGSFAGLDRNRQFELQGNSSNSSVHKMVNYGNLEYDQRGIGGWDRQEQGLGQRSSHDIGLSRQDHGAAHRDSHDGGLSRQGHGAVHRSLHDGGLSRQDHGVVHRASHASHDGGLSRQDHGVVHRAMHATYDGGLSRQDHDVNHRSLHDSRLISQDHGVVQRSSRETQRTPPGFPSNPQAQGGRNLDGWNKRNFEQNVGIANDSFGELNSRAVTSIENGRSMNPSHVNNKAHALQNSWVTEQFDRPGPPTGSNLHSVRASGIEESLQDLHAEINNIANEHVYQKQTEIQNDVDGSDDKSDNKKAQNFRDKYARSDTRGNWLLSQKMRNQKRQMICRSDIGTLNAPLLTIYESLIPAVEEKAKQKQLLTLLERLVSEEWPEAKLYLYGSCANSFDVAKSDIDVCLAIDDTEINKSDFLLRLAEILESNNLQNVQALTRARVPIVKLKDPVTGISCDICMNNVLAVVNTKLLRDYAEIDVRLRQLAFLVKHWAKSRGVNETYQGTLSSYAYVLMCIHFLQQRKPAVLPCLQGMETTYFVTVNDVKCAYFDRVEELYGYGSRNKESIAQLLWGFFNYWAYGHDYANNAISVRTGSIISKRSKDWTTRVGNDRHLICIEDPFQTSHDLGRVVDKYSIKVVREEFERAAHIMQHDPNPCVKLFEPYVPEREPYE